MDTLEQDLTDSWTATQKANTPGQLEIASIEESQAVAAREESDVEADKAWRESGNTEPYDYRGAHFAGADVKKGPLPNKFLTPKPVNVAGYNMATGKKSFNAVETDVGGAIKEANDRLSKSSFVPKKDPPPEDVPALGVAAQSFVRNGYQYADFNRMVPTNHTSEQRQKAWKSAVDAVNLQSLEAYMSWKSRQPMPVVPADTTFEETLANPKFAAAARKIYKANWGDDLEGSDLDASQWLADHMRWLDWNATGAAIIVGKQAMSGRDAVGAYAEALGIWEKTEMEPDVVAQLVNAGRAIVDPVNLIGGGVGKLTLMTVGRKALSDVIKRIGVGAAVGGAVGGMAEVGRANLQGEDPTLVKVLSATGAGAVTAGGMSEVVPEVMEAGKKGLKRVWQNIEEGALRSPPAGSPGAQRGNVNLEGQPANKDAPRPFVSIFEGRVPPRVHPDTGFYHPVEYAVANMPQEQMTGADFVNWIYSGKLKDVKEKELDRIGIREKFVDQSVVTREDALRYVQAMDPNLRVEILSNAKPTGPTAHQWLLEQHPQYGSLAREIDNINTEITAINQDFGGLGVQGAQGEIPHEPFERLRSLEAQRDNAENLMSDILFRSFEPEERGKPLRGALHAMNTLGKWGMLPTSDFQNLLVTNPAGSQLVAPVQHFPNERGLLGWTWSTSRVKIGGLDDLERVRVMEELQSDIHQWRYAAERRWKDTNPNDDLGYDQHVWQQWRFFNKNEIREASPRQRRDPQKQAELEKREKILEMMPILEQGSPAALRAALLNDHAFWRRTSQGRSSSLQPLELMPDHMLSLAKAQLFQTAKSGEKWFGWLPGEVQRERWSSAGPTGNAYEFEVQPGTMILKLHPSTKEVTITGYGKIESGPHKGEIATDSVIHDQFRGKEVLDRLEQHLSGEELQKLKDFRAGIVNVEPLKVRLTDPYSLGGTPLKGDVLFEQLKDPDGVIKGYRVTTQPTEGVRTVREISPSTFAQFQREFADEGTTKAVNMLSRWVEGARPAQSIKLELDKPFVARKQQFGSYDTTLVEGMNKFLKARGFKDRDGKPAKIHKINVNKDDAGGVQWIWGVEVTPDMQKDLIKNGVPYAQKDDEEETKVA